MALTFHSEPRCHEVGREFKFKDPAPGVSIDADEDGILFALCEDGLRQVYDLPDNVRTISVSVSRRRPESKVLRRSAYYIRSPYGLCYLFDSVRSKDSVYAFGAATRLHEAIVSVYALGAFWAWVRYEEG